MEQWNGIVWSTDKSANHSPKTGVYKSVLEEVGKASVAIPEDFVRISSVWRSLKLTRFAGDSSETSSSR
jgi:probable 2-oxoglutarate dehydrogenase E1 component DHKTD1